LSTFFGAKNNIFYSLFKKNIFYLIFSFVLMASSGMENEINQAALHKTEGK